ncbi:hypothetical protein FDJ70_09260 [Clostridium botulinum]|uniref:Uncharacterized protein n=1 Tax=Clostridium botulinum D str. 1873 TaxID=592027 RepID=A0A9P2LM58_CLOBO|nr:MULTISPECIES: hypothetical protein [Clostridium]EES92288.1 conserved hypothetical protein [Clostridium botulinum D str. 1873]MBO3442518.1 hypothetical protein [Clostridium haemolyticum]NFV47849.1 hypothetical protein [Clostridium botulinum]QPW55149.1 hypothetical protein IRP61_08075 [Clostridium botulinum]
MRKPSIFSNRYDEQMKKRKRIKIIFIVIAVLVLLIIASGILGNMLFGHNSAEKSKSKVQVKQSKKVNNTKINNSKKIEDSKEKDNINKEYLLKLSDGKEVKLLYDVVNNEKQYIGVMPKETKYTISPSKKSIALVENDTQKLILIDINGTSKEITKLQYVSSKGDIFKRENILKLNPNYIWCDEPKFLDDDNIVYISQLPWFNKSDTKYLWKYNISNNIHENNLPNMGEVSGKKIEYGNLTSEGLEVIVDAVKNTIIIKNRNITK